VFTRASSQSLSWATCIPSTHSHTISLRYIPILFYYLHFGLLSSFFLSSLLTKTLYAFLTFVSHVLHPCLYHHPWFDYPDNTHIWWNIQSTKPFIIQSIPASLCSLPLRSRFFPQDPVVRHPQTMFFLIVGDQVSLPYKTTGKIIVLCILIFKLLEMRQVDKKDYELNDSKHSQNLICF